MSWTRRAFVSVLATLGIISQEEAVQEATAETDTTDAFDYGLGGYGEGGYGGTVPDCFIATAACGTGAHGNVIALRQFRDDILRESLIGRCMIRLYYQVSPPIANWISRRPYRRNFVRTLLIRPAVRITRPLIKE